MRAKAPHPDFTPRTALITGAAKGIGAAVAKHLAARGIAVAIHYRSSAKDARSVLAQCRKAAPDSMLIQGDLVDPDAVARVCQAAETALGSIDVLFNNVGNYIRKDLLEMSIEEWRDQVESNLYTAYFTCRTVLPRMMKRKQGRIINVGYAGTTHPFYNRKTVPYHIAKTGVATLTRALAAIAAPCGVTVNSIGMGVMENSVRKPDNIPAGRFGKYADVCNAVDFFLKAESEYVNGTQLDISGGWLPEQIL